MLRARLERETGPDGGSRARGDHDCQQRDPSRRVARGLSGRAWPASSPSPSSTSARDDWPRRRHAALQASRRRASRKSRAITRRSASARTPTRSPKSKRCGTRGGTRSIATSARSRTQPTDPDFVDLHEMPFEPDAALLLCSDGLTDLVESATIDQIVTQLAGRPHDVVNALIEAANDAGGKDNVTVVYVEGELFAASRARSSAAVAAARQTSSAIRIQHHGPAALDRPGSGARAERAADEVSTRGSNRARRAAGDWSIAAARRCDGRSAWLLPSPSAVETPVADAGVVVVRADGIDRGRPEPRAAGIAGRRRAWRIPRAPRPEGRRPGGQPRAARRDHPAAGRGVRSRPGGGRRPTSRTPSSSGSASSATPRRRWARECSSRALGVSIVDVEITGALDRGHRLQPDGGRRRDRQRHSRQPRPGAGDPVGGVAADRSQRVRPKRPVRASSGVAHHRGRCGTVDRGQRISGSDPESVPVPGRRRQAERHARELVSGQLPRQDRRQRPRGRQSR